MKFWQWFLKQVMIGFANRLSQRNSISIFLFQSFEIEQLNLLLLLKSVNKVFAINAIFINVPIWKILTKI